MDNVKQDQLRVDLGRIYPTAQEPTWAIYSRSAIETWGANAIPISHHWDRLEADRTASALERIYGQPMRLVELSTRV